ncbi:TIM barrel protein [Paenibacillus sp. HB172176]|uniref:sugar phosphate isomerase/epimerase family protein n=1 Tax=Paenibacillus sp. HB172176 TaxID=2493690 RepID=UPI001439E88A|nr:TIM barrel protein [Paenibacillus sp. HB172176]
MKKSMIAAQLYTLREYCKDEAGLRDALTKVKEIGYDAVQVSGVSASIAPEAVKAITDELGLTICATHIGFDAMLNDFDAVVAKHKLWNCKYVGLGSIPGEYRGTKEGYLDFASKANEVSKRLKEHDLEFVYHNHHFEYTKFDGKTGMELLQEATDPSAFGFELDMYWVQAGGANPVDAVHGVDGRMKVVHLKDMAIVDDKQVFAEVGEGNLNFPAIIKACREIGVEWYVVEQDTCMRDPFESLAMSYNYLLTLAE